jgi:hypothetical protein
VTDAYLVRTAAAAGDLLAVASERLRLRALRSMTTADTSFSVARAFGSDGGLQIVQQNEKGDEKTTRHTRRQGRTLRFNTRPK